MVVVEDTLSKPKTQKNAEGVLRHFPHFLLWLPLLLLLFLLQALLIAKLPALPLSPSQCNLAESTFFLLWSQRTCRVAVRCVLLR